MVRFGTIATRIGRREFTFGLLLSLNRPSLASVFIALAAPTATMAAPTPTVDAAFIADDIMHEIALKKVRVKPKSTPEQPHDPSYLKGTNIPRRITAPSSN